MRFSTPTMGREDSNSGHGLAWQTLLSAEPSFHPGTLILCPWDVCKVRGKILPERHLGPVLEVGAES